jgi:hypothetical protein
MVMNLPHHLTGLGTIDISVPAYTAAIMGHHWTDGTRITMATYWKTAYCDACAQRRSVRWSSWLHK